jgi:transposase
MMRFEGHGVRVHLEHEMDTSTVEPAKNTSSRGGKRRMRTLEEKRQIVEEVIRGSESVAVIARRHEVNANLVFSWKRQYEKGLLEPSGTALVPVRVRKQSLKPTRSSVGADDACVEIDLGAGKCMRLRGELARALLDRVVGVLGGR